MTFEVTTLTFVLNVAIRVVTAIIFVLFLIPLIVKEAAVKNGLRQLRYEMLMTGAIIFTVNTVGLSIILLRSFDVDTSGIVEVITFINSFGFLAYALVKLKIYTQSYTPEKKRLHEKIAKLEEKELKKSQAKSHTK